VGFALLVIVAGTLIFFSYSKKSSDQIVSSQLNNIGSTIMSNAESMYVLGNESWVTMEFNFPSNVKSAVISTNKEMFFSFSTSVGTSYVVFFSDKFNISTGDPSCVAYCSLGFTPGINKVRIKSLGNTVSISKVN
jgi:hypothetical protein